MKKALVRALPSADLVAETPGEPNIRRVTVEGVDVLLGRLTGGPVVAFAARCPHQQTNLEDATFFDGLVRCPLHVYLYDPQTGANVLPARDADPASLWKLKPGYLPIHPVEEREGWIWVGPDPRPAPRSFHPELERPPAAAPEAAPDAGPVAAAMGPVLHPSRTLRVAPGATFTLRLPTTPKAGFVWRVETGGPLLAVVEERFDFGDPPRHLIRVTARGEGESTLRCLYARPWDSQAAEVRTYVVRVELG
ncbi:MAG: protease inhibitor I42 family protein [Actinomycetota bacterium]|nr:protease inhibitor I42 family protein [Actinomycetota bacterium]